MRHFDVSCSGCGVLQLGANAQLEEDPANIIVSLLEYSALDDTVYLEMHKYEMIEKGTLRASQARWRTYLRGGDSSWLYTIRYNIRASRLIGRSRLRLAFLTLTIRSSLQDIPPRKYISLESIEKSFTI